MTLDLFGPEAPFEVCSGAVVYRRMACEVEHDLLRAIHEVSALARPRHMQTARGYEMSVLMTNCGSLGWLSDRAGYRYSARDPDGGRPWPPLPPSFDALARRAAARAGYDDFVPDACIINRYAPGARMSLHQDRNERDLRHPIVSVSLGLSATFLFGGDERKGRTTRVLLEHGDIVVFGGPARLRFHGILPVREGTHPLTGPCRYNLTLRRAG